MNGGAIAEQGHRKRPRKFDGEDVSPTTRKELRGWYGYGIAAEIFAVCGVGSFVPVTLEQLARERGVLWSDKVTPCVVPPGAETTAALLARAQDNGQCMVKVFGAEVSTASFVMYTLSVAVIVQAVTLASFSSAADYGTYRKKLLLAFGYTGGVAAMLFIILVPKLYMLGSVLVIVGVTCLGSSFVLLNSFLPLLAVNHPDLSDYEGEDGSKNEPASSSGTSIDVSSSAASQLTAKISSKGVGLGYAAAVSVQVIGIGLLLLVKKLTTSTTLPLRLVVFMSGLFWFSGTIPTQLWLRNRPGPPLPDLSSSSAISRTKIGSCLSYISFAWLSLFKTIKAAFQLRQVVIFLVAWFLLSDAIATVSGTAILFARTELKMGTVAIALLSITVTTSGVAGAFAWPRLAKSFNLPQNKVIILCMCLMETIPLYGLLGYIPFLQSLGWGGLQQSWEIYPLGVIHGFVMGGLSSYCRAFFGRLIPPGKEASFFALFAITDKGSSAVGPAVVGRIVDATGHIRPAFFFLAVLIALPIPLVWWVDGEAGRKDAIAFVQKGSSEVEMRRVGGEEVEGLLSDDEEE